MHIIFGNYGNHSLALIQWAYEKSLQSVYVVSVQTGWEAESWQLRVMHAEDYVRKIGFEVFRLKAKPTFPELVRDRKKFPSQKFQWCASFMKGLPLLNWLDQVDPYGDATILLGKRRLDSRLNENLAEYIQVSEHYGERKVWHPLYKTTDNEFHALISRSGFPLLKHRSLECDPCIHNQSSDFKRMSTSDILKTTIIESELNSFLFDSVPIEEKIKSVDNNCSQLKDSLENFYMGCGSPFACGE